MFSCKPDDWSQPSGLKPGRTLPPHSEWIPLALPGDDGSLTNVVTSALVLAGQMTPTFIAMALHDCCMRYVNGDFTGAAQRLTWLRDVLDPITRLDAYLAQGVDQATAINAHAIASIRALHGTTAASMFLACSGRAALLLCQLRLGLDYYGEAANHVTLVSPDKLKVELDDAIRSGKVIEDAYNIYIAQEKDVAAATVQLQKQQSVAMQSIGGLTSQSAGIPSQQHALIDSIDKLGDELLRLGNELFAADETFKTAVASKGKSCHFGQLLKIAAAIATVVASGGAAGVALMAAGSIIQGKPQVYADGKTAVGDDFTGLKYQIGKLVDGGTTAATFYGAMQGLVHELAPPQSNTSAFDLPSDSAKIVASAQTIETSLKPFLESGMAEAKAFDVALRAYVTTAIARNNKMIEYDSLAAMDASLQGQIARTKAEIELLQDRVAQTQSPFLAEARNFMANAWLESKSNIVRLLTWTHQAYRYYSLDDTTPLLVVDFSIPSLTAAAASLQKEYLDAFVSAGHAATPMNKLSVDLRPYMTKAQLAAFQRTGVLTVTLDARRFLPNHHVFVNQVELEFRTPGGIVRNLAAHITHHGNPVIFDNALLPHSYSHKPVTVPYGKLVDEAHVSATAPKGKVDMLPNTFDGSIPTDSGYVGLSPIATWTIDLDTSSKTWALRITGATMIFSGSVYG